MNIGEFQDIMIRIDGLARWALLWPDDENALRYELRCASRDDLLILIRGTALKIAKICEREMSSHDN